VSQEKSRVAVRLGDVIPEYLLVKSRELEQRGGLAEAGTCVDEREGMTARRTVLFLQPGAVKNVSLRLGRYQLAFYDHLGKRHAPILANLGWMCLRNDAPTEINKLDPVEVFPHTFSG
jgi:hypothetical protein